MKRDRLTAEPGLDADVSMVIQVLIRMPDGSRKNRRFRKDDTLQALFDFIDVNSDVKAGSYQLVRRRVGFERRRFYAIFCLEEVFTSFWEDEIHILSVHVL